MGTTNAPVSKGLPVETHLLNTLPAEGPAERACHRRRWRHRRDQRHHPRLVPWNWGVTGVWSVMGTTLAAVLAMSYGFVVVKALATLLYVCAVALIVRQVRAEANA